MDYIVKNWWQLLLLLPVLSIPVLMIIAIIYQVFQKNYEALIFLLFIIITIIGIVNLSRSATFEYKTGLVLQAKDFNTAAKKCFKKLTNNKYPGEKQGLVYIDICANPVKGEIK